MATDGRSQQNPDSLSCVCYKRDALAVVLVDRFHFTARKAALLGFVWALLQLAAPLIAFASMPLTYGYGSWHKWLFFGAESGAIPFYLIIYPALAAFYLWITRVPESLFVELEHSGVLVLETAHRRELRTRLDRLFARRWDWIAAAMTLAACAAWYLYAFHWGVPRFGDFFFSGNPTLEASLGGLRGNWDVTFLLNAPGTVAFVYMLIMIVFRGGQIIWALSYTFNAAAIDVEPLHPDKCGGLRTVSQYAVRCSYLVATCGLGLGLLALASAVRGTILSDYVLFSMIGLYVILAPSFYFLTLGTAHKGMQASKDRFLDAISKRFDEIYAQANDHLRGPTCNPGASQLKDYLDQLQQLDTLYKRTDAFPVWPFDTSSLSRFVGAVSISLVPTAISIGIKVFQ